MFLSKAGKDEDYRSKMRIIITKAGSSNRLFSFNGLQLPLHRMKRLLTFVLSLTLFTVLAVEYQPFEQDGKYGLKDEAGRIVINPSFEGLGWSDGSFSVVGQVTGYKLGSRWGLINLKGQRITKADFINLTPSAGDRVVVKKEIDAITTKMGCLDLQGNIKVPLKYDGIKINGLQAIVFNKRDNSFYYGVINLNGEVIIPLEYKNIISVGSIRYGVFNKENKAALFSESGVKLYDFVIDSISSFYKNRAIFYQGLNQGIINRDGIVEIPPQFREIIFNNERDEYRAKVMTEWVLMDNEHKVFSTATCDELLPNSNGYVVKNGNRFGVWDTQFHSVIPITYDYLYGANNNLAIAKQQGKYGLISSANEVILPFNYDSICVSNNFVRLEEKLLGRPSWVLYDTYGIRKSERSYESISAFNGKFFEVRNYGLSGVMNRYGKETVHCVYDSILNYSDNQILVKFHGHYGIIDFNENWILPPQPNPVQLVDDDHYILQEEGNYHFKNFKGDLIYCTDNPIEINQFVIKETLPDGTVKEISFQGITISRTAPPVTVDTQIISDEFEGYRGIKKNGKYGFIDDKGRLRIANRYEAIGNFKNGYAPVKILGKWGFVNTQDQIVINPSYRFVSDFENSIAIVKKDKFGFIDREGKAVLETRYDSIYRARTNKFIVVHKHLFGLADENGVVLIEPRFESLEDLGNGYVIVSREKKYGLLTTSGFSTIPMIYDNLYYIEKENKYLAKKESPWITLKLN